MRDIRGALLACLLALAACAWGPATAAEDHGVLVLGCVSDDPKSDYDRLKPLLDYLVPRMADVGIHGGQVLMARDMQQMGSYLRRGRIDWVTGSVATGLQLQARAGATPMLVSERNGLSRGQSVVFVRRDSSIERLDDLQGHAIAFRNTSDSGAYLVPAMQLLQEGMSLQRLLSPMDRPDGKSVGYVLGGSTLNIATWVARGLVDAGAMNRADFDNPQRTPTVFRRSFRIIAASPEYPLALEVTRGDLDARVQARLRDLLIAASTDPDAREAMLQFERTARFIPIDSWTSLALARLRAGIGRVRAEVE